MRYLTHTRTHLFKWNISVFLSLSLSLLRSAKKSFFFSVELDETFFVLHWRISLRMHDVTMHTTEHWAVPFFFSPSEKTWNFFCVPWYEWEKAKKISLTRKIRWSEDFSLDMCIVRWRKASRGIHLRANTSENGDISSFSPKYWARYRRLSSCFRIQRDFLQSSREFIIKYENWINNSRSEAHIEKNETLSEYRCTLLPEFVSVLGQRQWFSPQLAHAFYNAMAIRCVCAKRRCVLVYVRWQYDTMNAIETLVYSAVCRYLREICERGMRQMSCASVQVRKCVCVRMGRCTNAYDDSTSTALPYFGERRSLE